MDGQYCARSTRIGCVDVTRVATASVVRDRDAPHGACDPDDLVGAGAPELESIDSSLTVEGIGAIAIDPDEHVGTGAAL